MKYNYLDRSRTMPIKELKTQAFTVFIFMGLLGSSIAKILLHNISFSLIVNCTLTKVKHYYQNFMFDDFIIIKLMVNLFEIGLQLDFKLLIIIKLID